MNTIHVKTGDAVVVLSGKDKGKQGKVLAAYPEKERVVVEKVVVEGINIVSKHVKPRRMGETGGILKVEGPMHACKVQLVCPKCGKPTRVAHKINADGTKQRVCKKCGETF